MTTVRQRQIMMTLKTVKDAPHLMIHIYLLWFVGEARKVRADGIQGCTSSSVSVSVCDVRSGVSDQCNDKHITLLAIRTIALN